MLRSIRASDPVNQGIYRASRVPHGYRSWSVADRGLRPEAWLRARRSPP
jgi:hypothetical protein